MKHLLATLFFFALAVVTHAQPGLPTAPDQAPIDGGLSLLALGGGAYAAWKLKRKAKS